MNNSEQVVTKKKTNKVLLGVLIASGLCALITIILMDCTNFGLLKINKLTNNAGLIDSKFFYTSTALYEYFDLFNNEALTSLRIVHAIDYGFMLSVLVFEVTLVVILAKKDFRIVLVTVFAFLEFLFDASENLLIDFVIKKLPDKVNLIAGLAGGMTLFKWIFTILYIVITLSLIISLIVKKYKNKNTSQENEIEDSTAQVEVTNTGDDNA